MKDENEEFAQKVALFRYGLIADLVRLERGEGLYEKLREKEKKTYVIPGSDRPHVAAETMRTWLRTYRKHGFEGLLPKPRADLGRSRALPQEAVDLIVMAKEEHPDATLDDVIAFVRAAGVDDEVKLAHSTVHRVLARHGLAGRRKPSPSADRRKFAFERAGQLWMSDAMHGPKVRVGPRMRKTYLLAFLDDATRVVPHAEFALHENTQALLPVLKQALLRRGIPERLYVDNGSAFRSHRLHLACAKVGISLIHGRPYQPQGKGKIERWFRTARQQLVRTLQDQDRSSLDALNRRLRTWVEAEYHRAPHRGLDGETPLDRWAQTASSVRSAADMDLDDLFLEEEKRKVHKDRTVSLHGRAYEADPILIGKAVTLRFDPERPKDPIQVFHDGKRYPDAPLVDAYANCFVKRNPHHRGIETGDTLPVQPSVLTLSTLGHQEDDNKEAR